MLVYELGGLSSVVNFVSRRQDWVGNWIALEVGGYKSADVTVCIAEFAVGRKGVGFSVLIF